MGARAGSGSSIFGSPSSSFRWSRSPYSSLVPKAPRQQYLNPALQPRLSAHPYSLFSPRTVNTDERRLQDKPPIYSGEFVRDLNFYKDSCVNETYLQTRFRVWPKLIVQQAVRARFNWQRGGELYNGLFQRKRRLDLWSWVSRMERSAHLGKLKLTAQYKFMALRLVDRERDVKFTC